ncbi:DUF6716 putative glycosyltransferase [Microbacterium dauci]|uniref:Uncharacterized protein n=1 Tax=Microbacterium dauci TaxID=3048008 RepID=A0ABT6ZEN9_9MICO|nr:DUF6716 putative glycosyltransferase [Microbacterium sp. LX3-4]MDJ1114092.1 hypothetical protein [Microbacterium sp. LX3-4]
MTFRAERAPRLRVVVIADADSFVKWGTHLVDAVPGASRHLLLVRTPLTVNDTQLDAALTDTTFGGDRVTRVDFDEVPSWLTHDRPDIVVLAGRGPFVRLLGTQIDRVHPRPVVVAGLPGISIPALRGAAQYRKYADLFVVHSHREVRAFRELGATLGIATEPALATLPFARRRSVAGGTDLVFAAQALIPRSTEERMRMADILRDAALADPTRRVVVKLRARAGEAQTHEERVSLETLLRDRPDNLVFSYEPMSQALETAEGLVTVSSTAAIEAIAAGIPVIALDEFGVSKDNINTVFARSGLLGTAADVAERQFRHPNAVWMRDNYFHDQADATWWARAQRLVARRRAGELAARRVPTPRGGALHAAWHRRSVLGDADRTVSGAIAVRVGGPIVRALVALQRLRRPRVGSWRGADDFTLTPSRNANPVPLR